MNPIRRLIRDCFWTYCFISGIIVAGLIGYWIYRFSTMPSLDYYYTRLNQSDAVTIDQLELGRSVSYQRSDPMFRVIRSEMISTFAKRPCSSVVAPIALKVTFYDGDKNALLGLIGDGKHVQCGNEVFDSEFQFHLLFE